MDDLKEHLIDIGKDVLLALLILGLILGSLYMYSGRWPPMVVIESSSMSHSNSLPPESQLGAIDTGDIVTVKSIEDKDDIVTYVEGKANDHKTYGQYGDVVIYQPYGNEERTPIIHRPVVYLHYDSSNDSFDVPGLEKIEYGEDWTYKTPQQGEKVERSSNLTGSITIKNYGYRNDTVRINLQRLLDRPPKFKHSGFITRGDNNNRYDQTSEKICLAPIKDDWVEGKARGELPWFGILKLTVMGRAGDVPSNSWEYLGISLFIIVALPFVIDFGIEYYQEEKEENENEGGPKEEPEEEKGLLEGEGGAISEDRPPPGDGDEIYQDVPEKEGAEELFEEE